MMNRLRDESVAALRALGRSPRLTLTMIVTLAVGLGANTTIFSLVRSVLFAEADFGPSSGRVVSLYSLHPSRAQQVDDAELSRAEFDLVRSSVPELERVEAYVSRNFTLGLREGASRALGASVTPGLFDMIHARPALGRSFGPEDAHDFGFETNVILSDALWKREYGADPGIVGRTVAINGRSLEVIGVMPEGFGFPMRGQLWLAYRPELPGASDGRFLQTLGLLKPEATVRGLAARLAPLSLELERRLPDTQRDYRLNAGGFPAATLGSTPQSMTALFLAVLMVLLIVCANLAGLLLARAGRVRWRTRRPVCR